MKIMAWATLILFSCSSLALAMTNEESDAYFWERINNTRRMIQAEIDHQRALQIAEKEIEVLGRLEQLSAPSINISANAYSSNRTMTKVSNKVENNV